MGSRFGDVRSRPLTIILIVCAVLFAVVLFVFVVPSGDNAACKGIDLRSVGAKAGDASGERPAVAGAGLREKLRAIFVSDERVGECSDFADPFVLRHNGEYFAYSTNSDGMLVPVLHGGNLFAGASRSDALPKLPGWSEGGKGRVWAPAVLPRGDSYVLYYTTGEDDRQCISFATAQEAQGPFRDDSQAPFICPAHGGAIDASPFVDRDGRAFLLWKDLENGTIVGQELTADGRGLVGAPTTMLAADQPWEAGVVEGPAMYRAGNRYFLLYSANDWRTAQYAVGYAICTGPLGPCIKASDQPWLGSSEGAQGPGGPEVFQDEDGHRWLVLHAWVNGKVGYPDGARDLFVLRLRRDGDQLVAA